MSVLYLYLINSLRKVKANKKKLIASLAFKGHTNHPYLLEGDSPCTIKYQKK
nr:MAG TPA: hypothetical protein [Crassvirales sp.]